MYDINEVVLVGRLTQDPELSYTKGNNTPICKFSIANNQTNEDKYVSFFDVVTWNKIAENCNKFLKKGSRVIIEGRIEQNRYQDNNGQNRSKIYIVANKVQFIENKNQDNNQQNNTQSNTNIQDDPVPEDLN